MERSSLKLQSENNLSFETWTLANAAVDFKLLLLRIGLTSMVVDCSK